MALNLKLKEWTEIEAALLELGKCLGIYDESIELENIPKHILWSNSEGNKEVENLNNILRVLVQLGALEERDGLRDYEFRWNPTFRLKWVEKNSLIK